MVGDLGVGARAGISRGPPGCWPWHTFVRRSGPVKSGLEDWCDQRGALRSGAKSWGSICKVWWTSEMMESA